ncbi:MAG: TRIC cation channel family protein [Betaproteobacteria bacterium]|nr:TRIC cation channel family protein [Betaproteobacteria bacterium]
MRILAVIDVIGVFAFALSGLIEARRRDMDLVGLFVVALVTAFGGGTLRDLLLDRTPLFWIEHDIYAIAILGLAVAFALIPATGRCHRACSGRRRSGWACSASPAGYALEAGTSAFIAALMGVITGTFGGVIRDVLCNELPSLFRQTRSTRPALSLAVISTWRCCVRR